jgi:hypothetical protein
MVVTFNLSQVLNHRSPSLIIVAMAASIFWASVQQPRPALSLGLLLWLLLRGFGGARSGGDASDGKLDFK